MLAGEIYAPRKVRLIDAPEPEWTPGCGEMIFAPKLACLCGSDMLFFEADYPEYTPHVGQSLHEMIGRVERIDESGPFREGDRVLCVPVEHYGCWERFRVSSGRAIPIDPRCSDTQAVLAQPLGTVICGIKKVRPVIDRDVAVVGQGPIGQLFCSALRNLGARRIIALDLLPERLEMSRRMGATHTVHADGTDVVDQVRQCNDGELPELVVEAVGHREQVLNLCIQLCRPHGQILFFGVPPETIDGLRLKDLFWKNLAVITSVGPDFSRDFPMAMQWIAEGRVDVEPLVSHRLPWERVQEAFDRYHQRDDGAMKVFVEFPGTA